MRCCKIYRFITTTLFLFISPFVFSQVKVNIEIEGEGVVCIQDSSFDGQGRYKYEDAEFFWPWWGWEEALTIRIKPGKQCYLDGVWVSQSESDSSIQIPKSSIYAVVPLDPASSHKLKPIGIEKNELCYDVPDAETFATYRFVF